MTTNASPAPAWDEGAVRAEAIRAVESVPATTTLSWPHAVDVILAVVREHLPVKPDREAVARAWHESAPECSPGAWDRVSERVRDRSLPRADAVLDLWPGRSEAEVKREGAVEALRAYAADLNLHTAVQDGWEKYGDDLCGDDPDPCLFWDMTHAEQKRINDRADRLAAEGGDDRG